MELRCWTQGAQEAYGVQEAQEAQDAQETQEAHGYRTEKMSELVGLKNGPKLTHNGSG